MSPVQQLAQQSLAKSLRPVNHHPAGVPLAFPHTGHIPVAADPTRYRPGGGPRGVLASADRGVTGQQANGVITRLG